MTIPFLPSSLGAVLFFLTIHDLPAWPRRHLLSFLDAYEQLGLPMWGLSPQNEPTQKVRWNSMSWTAEAMRDFLRLDLGPELRQRHPTVDARRHARLDYYHIWTHNPRFYSLHQVAAVMTARDSIQKEILALRVRAKVPQ